MTLINQTRSTIFIGWFWETEFGTTQRKDVSIAPGQGIDTNILGLYPATEVEKAVDDSWEKNR